MSAFKPPERAALSVHPGDRYRWPVMAVIAFGLVASLLPSASFVVAIPALMAAYGVGQVEGQLIMTVFMVTNTIAMLPAPWLIRRFGMRRCFLWSMGVVCATSVLGALSPSFGFLIAVRALQGLGTGTLVPMGGIAVMSLFPPPEQGRASGIFGLAITLAPAMAPAIGGLLVDAWGWRAVSLMPLPVGLAAWAMGARFLPAAEAAPADFDFRGMLLLALLSVGWLGIATHFSAGRHWFVASLALLFASLLAFIRHARRCPDPLFALDVICARRVAMGAILGFVFGFGVYSSSYIVPMYFQAAQGLSATRAGAAVMPGTLVLAFSYPVAGMLLDRFSPRQVMAGGMVIFAVSWSVLGGLGEHLSYVGFVIVLVISRIGYGFSNTPLNQAALAGLNAAALGQASAAIGYVRQVGGVFGVAALAAFVEWRTNQLGGGRAAQGSAYAEAFLLVALLSALSLAAIWNMRGKEKDH